MNHRKYKQAENLRKPKKEKYKSFANDPEDSVCPHCGQKGKSCSYVNSLSRAWLRNVCANKYKKKDDN